MKQVYCQKETEIIQALRCGALDAELEKHAATCAICADTLAVSGFFQADKTAAFVQHGHSERSKESRLELSASAVNENTQSCTSLPDADFLWWKAQLAGKQLAVERATRSIALVKKASYFGAAAAGLWLVFAAGHLGSILSTLSRQEIWPNGALGQSALFLGVAVIVFTLLGFLYFARSEK